MEECCCDVLQMVYLADTADGVSVRQKVCCIRCNVALCVRRSNCCMHKVAYKMTGAELA